VASLEGPSSGDWGRGTDSCLTLVKSVSILAIINNDALGGVEGCSDRTDRSRGAAELSACVTVVHLVW